MLLMNFLMKFFLDFIPGEIETYVFEEDGEFRIQKLFSALEDSIVEPGREVIEVVLSTNESLVEIVPDKRTQLLFIVDDDGQFIKNLFHFF